MTTEAPVMAVVSADKQHASKLAVTASSKASPLRWMTGGSPTNHNMLLFRTLNSMPYLEISSTLLDSLPTKPADGILATVAMPMSVRHECREMQQPNANADHLAPLLRDKLMPLRMWWLRHAPGGWKQFRKALEHEKLGCPGVCNFVDARTKWFDKIVADSITHHGIQQVVCVAAGFDTRAYRFGAMHPGVHFVEVDLPHASIKKQKLVDELLQPESAYPRPTYIAADLSTTSIDRVLLQQQPAGNNSNTQGSSKFDPTAPTLFTVEGLIYYLPEVAVQQLFRAILKVAAPGSRVAFDFLHKDVWEGSVALPPAYRVTAQSVANKGEPFISGITNSRAAVQAFADSIMHTGTDAAAVGEKRQVVRQYQVSEFLSPKQMVHEQLPHLKWDSMVPPILSFYSFAMMQVEDLV